MLTQLRYLQTNGLEHIWGSSEGTPAEFFFAGAVLGSEVIRVRLLRGAEAAQLQNNLQGQQTLTCYQLADGGSSTLPYHSWL